MFGIMLVSPLWPVLGTALMDIKPHHFRCLRGFVLECVLLVSARNHVFFILFSILFSIFVYTLLSTLQMPGLSHSLLLDSRFLQLQFSRSQGYLGVTYFQNIGAVCSPPLLSHPVFFLSGNLKFGKLVTGEVPSEACEGGDPVTLTSSQLGKGNRNVI